MAVAADVPGRFDVVINGKGYTFLRTLDGSYLTANRHRAEYAYTDTFIERSNVSSVYGDNAQDFFLTSSQTDWSLGVGQDFLNLTDADSLRMFQSASGADVSHPGYITPHFDSIVGTNMTFAMKAVGVTQILGGQAYAGVSATNLYTAVSDGIGTDQGAHGAGTPCRWGVCSDGVNTFIAGSTAIRKVVAGATFSTFSASANRGSLAFLNNTLFSCDGSSLRSYDSAGTETVLYTWKDAAGAALTALTRQPKLVPYGGKLLIFWDTLIDRAELWVYDGVGTSKLAELSYGVAGYDCLVAEGIVFMSTNDGNLWYYASGTIGKAWDKGGTANTPLGSYQGNVLFGDGRRYNISTGAVDTIGFPVGQWMASTPVSSVSATAAVMVAFSTAVAPKVWPDASTYKTPVTVNLSSIDFGNTLPKAFRSIRVDFEKTNNVGSIPSVDVGYIIDGISGSATALATGVTSGAENLLPAGTTGTSILPVITINDPIVASHQGTIKVKKVYVRAAPIQQAYKLRTYNLDLTSIPSFPTQLEDGTYQPLSGEEQAVNLQTAITATAPFSVTDKFGTYTGVCMPGNCSIFELHSSEDAGANKPGQYIAQIQIREV